MSIQSQDVYAGPGMLISALSSGGTASPNVVVSTLVAANYVSTGQVRADGVETTNILTASITAFDVLNVGNILTAVNAQNPTGSLYINSQGFVGVSTQTFESNSDIILFAATSTATMSATSTLGISAGSGMSIEASTILMYTPLYTEIYSDLGMRLAGLSSLIIDSPAITIGGRNWAQLVSTIDGLPR